LKMLTGRSSSRQPLLLAVRSHHFYWLSYLQFHSRSFPLRLQFVSKSDHSQLNERQKDESHAAEHPNV
ncbi:hypothetical protein PFISCL1PPCAC_22490, partial [Pristionchus fissidentatus]